MCCAKASLFGPKVIVMAPDGSACTYSRDQHLSSNAEQLQMQRDRVLVGTKLTSQVHVGCSHGGMKR